MELAQIIKYEGDKDTFIWKHPTEDFNTGSQLIVCESQEAVFFLNGQVMDLFGPGRYTLETGNIPLLRKIINIPTGGKTPFHCEIYFINKMVQMIIKWGTDSKVQYLEPTYKFPISIGVNGEMTLAVCDSGRLLFHLAGAERTLGKQQLTDFFRAFLMTKVKTYIAQMMKISAINIFEIDEKLEEFSDTLKDKLSNDFLSYGIDLRRFFVTAVVKPEGDPLYEKFKDLYFRRFADIAEAELQQRVGIIEQVTASSKMVIEAEGIAQKRITEGYTYQQERGFDVAEKAAENEGIGNLLNSKSASIKYCDSCGVELTPDTKFCDNCGTQVNNLSICSNCGFQFIRPGKFCPNCGSRRE